MLDSLGTIAEIVGAVLGISALAWTGNLLGRLRDAREQLSEMRAEVGDHERREQLAKADAKQLQTKVDQLQHDHESLQRVVTAKQELAELLGTTNSMSGDLREVRRMVEELLRHHGETP